MSTADTDQEMSSEQEMVSHIQQSPINQHLPQTPEHASMPSSRFTIRALGQLSYAGALKRTAEQAGNVDEDEQDDSTSQGNTGETTEIAPNHPTVRPPGLIKGLDDKIYANLDLQVHEVWENQAQEAIFIHYLDGGYNPNIAQNVHTIAEDLKGKPPENHDTCTAELTKGPVLYSDVYKGTEQADPTVVHPTAVTPMLMNRYAAPFLFLVTGLPEDFRNWLVSTGAHQVNSHLRLLFVENGTPVPHDYAVTLTNYNMRTETDILRGQAHQKVRQSVIDLLFDKPSDTSQRVAGFIKMYHDNLESTLSEDEARLSVRSSITIDSLDVIVPNTRLKTTVYNVYIHPPSAIPEMLERWRQFVSTQKYYTNASGVGVKYRYPWHCIHCKTIDHPSGLCGHMTTTKWNTREQNETLAAEDILPLRPIPSTPRNPNHGRRSNPRGRNGPTNAHARTRGSGSSSRGNSVRTSDSKRQKIN